MSVAEIQEGSAWVGGTYLKTIRVVDKIEDYQAIYSSYEMDGGYTLSSSCSLSALDRWADRPATPDEVARLDTRGKSLAQYEVAARVVERVPTALLIQALEQRGYKVAKS